VHFVGVGGIGMSGLAEILRTLDFDVTGSDLRAGENTRRLERLGVKVLVGHREQNVDGADVVVTSSAIGQDNPEVVAARRAGIPVIARAEMLAELMRVKYGVALAGSHGKTTTTSLIATVLRAAGFDPTVVVGGRMAALGSNAALGGGDLLVAEADESDGSFLRLSPTIAAITNIDPEHLDFYKTYDALKDAFVDFAEKVPFYGLAVLCLDHPAVQEILPRIRRRHVTYGINPQADYSARNVAYHGLHTSFDVFHRDTPLGEFVLRMPGQHNVLNALAVVAIADELEVPLDVMKEALATFGGVARRFTIVGTPGQVTLVDDYGHHPAEIRATLQAARNAYNRRILVAFQPHRHTRTESLFDEFTRAFNHADVLFVTDIYAAGEAPIEGVTPERLVEEIRGHGHQSVRYVSDRQELAIAIANEAKPGDVVLSLGAGDINKVLALVEREITNRLS
jgi:UDP-N-acetylmuramate--alanine ligase